MSTIYHTAVQIYTIVSIYVTHYVKVCKQLSEYP